MFRESGHTQEQERQDLETTPRDVLDQQLYAAGKRAGLSQEEIAASLQKYNTFDDALHNKDTLLRDTGIDIAHDVDMQRMQIEYKETIDAVRGETKGLKTSALISASNLNKETGIIDTQNIIQLPIYST